MVAFVSDPQTLLCCTDVHLLFFFFRSLSHSSLDLPSFRTRVLVDVDPKPSSPCKPLVCDDLITELKLLEYGQDAWLLVDAVRLSHHLDHVLPTPVRTLDLLALVHLFGHAVKFVEIHFLAVHVTASDPVKRALSASLNSMHDVSFYEFLGGVMEPKLLKLAQKWIVFTTLPHRCRGLTTLALHSSRPPHVSR